MTSRVVRTPEACFDNLPDFPFEPHYCQVPDPDVPGTTLRMHYLDEGPPDAPVVLLMHGEPTWSFLYRKMIPVLVDAGLRAVAPDHIGFGRSDKLGEKTAYSFARHISWLQALIGELRLCDVTLVCQDWGGPIGMGALASDPARFARVVAANTMLHTVDPALAGRLAFSLHGVGERDVCLSEALLNWVTYSQREPDFRASVALRGMAKAPISDAVLAAYDAPFPEEPHKAAMRQFPILIPMTRSDPGAQINRNTWSVLESFERPFLTAFSDSDPGTAGWEAIFRERVPGAQGQAHTTISNAGHFLQEDRGPEFAEVVVDFIRSEDCS